MKRTLAIVAALALPMLTQAQNLVVNGSFEQPSLAAGTLGIYANVTGWNATVGEIEIRNNVAGTASQGVQFLELDARINSTIHQTVSGLTTGSAYSFSFDYSNRRGTALSTNGMSWSLDGGTTWNDVVTPTDYVWHSFSGQFVATGSTTELMFRAINTSDALGTSLDNVSITAVPEPGTYALLLAGLGAFGVMSRRRVKR
ncbi:PEP-CTERM sorting domain-containing protein [Roseateles sp. BYS180W]|uniref:PEP-CTERM sorting domain-containing protein n=1 Tax=Roseateles rivi TaxID=3299028 RepID=A0ABW7FXT0_9BURK